MQTLTQAESGIAPRAGQYILKVTAYDTDTMTGPWSGSTSIGQRPPTDNPRAQLQGPYATYNKAGAETYYHQSIWVPPETTMPGGNSFQLLTQWHGTPFTASPNFALTSGGNGVTNRWAVTNDVGAHVNIWFGPTGGIARNQWHDFTYRIKWSYGSDGFIELWYNGVKQTLQNGQQRWTGVTLKGDQSQGVAFYVSHYRHKGDIPGPVTYYYDAVKVGSTFSIVQP
jgi:hypothetical protein